MAGSESGRKTTIWVSVELKEELRKIGHMGDTYEQVIWRLLEFWKKNERLSSPPPSLARLPRRSIFSKKRAPYKPS